jgi:hypothetical protein
MPRKHDPIFTVVDFFEAQPLAVAVSTLALCRRMVQQRQEAEGPPATTRRKRSRARPYGMRDGTGRPFVEPQPTEPPAVEAVPSPPLPARTRRRRAAALAQSPLDPAAPPRAGEHEPPLPGLGPATVGD